MIYFSLIVQKVISLKIIQQNEEDTIESFDISFENETELDYNIDNNKKYKFTIINDNFVYSFQTYFNTFIYKLNNNGELKTITNETIFEQGDVIYANYFLNLTIPITIKILSFPIHKEFNIFETIDKNQYFFIKPLEKSVAYFDAFDRNSKIYISENHEKYICEKDEKINGQFKIIEANKTYFIKNELYPNEVSIFKKYLYPLNLETQEIIINEEKIFLYLQGNKSYTLNFQENKNSKMIRLSPKTSHSEIYITQNGQEETVAINKDNPYHTIKEDFQDILLIKVNENDAFIEFLDYTDICDFFSKSPDEFYELEKKCATIIIKKTQKSFILNLNSENEFKYSLSLGLTQNEKYIYTTSSNYKINSNNKNIELKYEILFKNLDVLEKEFLSLTIFFEKENDQIIKISFSQESDLDSVLNEQFKSEIWEYILTDCIQKFLEIYVYNDIAKNPPEIPDHPNYHHKGIDLYRELQYLNLDDPEDDDDFLNSYEIYQEIKRILCSTKDLHFKIYLNKTFERMDFSYFHAYLPFKFIIKEYNNEQRIFLEKNGDYFQNFTEEEKKFIEEHLNIPLKKINDIDPFDYIQNWSQFLSTKNPHAQFTFIIDVIPFFFFYDYPVYLWNITLNEYEFEDNKILRLSHKIISDKNYNDNFQSNIYINNNIKNEEKTKNLDWNVLYEEKLNNNSINFLKCRVDKENKVNVFVQNSFLFDETRAIGKILNCAKLFLSNDYPIIIIENKNNGGRPKLAFFMLQLFQIFSVERTYSSYRLNAKEILKNEDINFINDTCEEINSISDLEEKTDFYKEIEHKKTKPMIEIPNKSERDALNHFREEFKNSTNLKKPTDILIFTDSFSYSSTSTLIKGFQNIGGAIIVGYFGNPKLKMDIFDSSQSDSVALYRDDLYKYMEDIVSEFEEVGFNISSITVREIFDDDYQKENPIPREYSFNPVDERVDIYSKYSDDIYDKFIEEGKKIYEKYHTGEYCNSKNDKVFLIDEKCKNINNLPHANGGYKCNNKGNTWNKTSCQPCYCDIGYYFDQYKQMCIEECGSEQKSFFIYEDDYSKEFNIKKDEAYKFYIFNAYDYYYSIKSSGEFIIINDEKYKLYYFDNNKEKENEIIINKDKNALNDIKIQIEAIKTNIKIDNRLKLDNIILIDYPYISIFEEIEDYVLYFNNLLQNKIKYAKYNDEMTNKDIININPKFFKNYTNEELLILEKNEIYFIYIDGNDIEQTVATSYINQYEIIGPINFDVYPKNYFYFKKNKTYQLNFEGNNYDIILKLSRETINSKVIIKEKNIILNETNLYYKFNDKEEINLEILKENAFIEILYNYINESDFEILDFGKSEYDLTKKFNMLIIPKDNYTSKEIIFELTGKENQEYLILHGYSLQNYFHKFDKDDNENKHKMNKNHYKFSIIEPYPDSINLIDKESYNLLFIKYSGKLNLKKEVKDYYKNDDESEEEKKNNHKEDKEEEGLEGWKIALISISSSIFLFFISCCAYITKCRKKVLNKEIEEDIHNLGPLEEELK